MTLRFDPDVRLYIGAITSVAADLFDEALAELVAGGADESEARALLLDEEQWIEEEAGPLDCPHCGQPLLPGMRFCGVRCEAAFLGPGEQP
jgi:hypothetical protein